VINSQLFLNYSILVTMLSDAYMKNAKSKIKE